MIEEVRIDEEMRSAVYKQKVAWYYNRKVKGKQFQTDNLVLKKAKVVGHSLK